MLQKWACYSCGKYGHKAIDCNTRKFTFINDYNGKDDIPLVEFQTSPFQRNSQQNASERNSCAAKQTCTTEREKKNPVINGRECDLDRYRHACS